MCTKGSDHDGVPDEDAAETSKKKRAYVRPEARSLVLSKDAAEALT